MATYVHIPRVGRHGMLLELKDDRGFCLILRDRIEKDKRRSAESNIRASARIPDENDMCLCGASGRGGVWSVIMSTLPDDWQDRVDSYFGRPTNREDFYDEDLYEMSEMIAHERERSERYMSEDISLASGETYRRY